MLSFMTYRGSKLMSARQYPNPVGVVCEPFAGSASYSVAHDVEVAILVDIDERVCQLWDYLIHASRSDILAIPLLGYDAYVSDMNASDEAKLLVSCWTSTAQFSNKMPSERYCIHSPSAHWGERRRAIIANQVCQIKKWKVVHSSYDSSPQSDTTFVDPPYQHVQKMYAHSQVVYEDLAEWCKNRSGRVIATECVGATWLPWNGSVSTHRMSRNKSTVCRYREVYWTNV